MAGARRRQTAQEKIRFDSLRTCYRAFRGRVGHHVSLLLRLPSAKECGRLAMDSSDSTLEVCCHLGIATEHAIYACSFAKALCRLCCRASYKRREACEQIFPSSACSAKQTCARVRSYPTKYYLFGVHAQVSYLKKAFWSSFWSSACRDFGQLFGQDVVQICVKQNDRNNSMHALRRK